MKKPFFFTSEYTRDIYRLERRRTHEMGMDCLGEYTAVDLYNAINGGYAADAPLELSEAFITIALRSLDRGSLC